MQAIPPTPRPARTGSRNAERVLLLAVCGALLATASLASSGWDAGARPSRIDKPAPKGLAFNSHKATVADPTGDTLGSGPVQIDITSFSVDAVGEDLVIGISFADAISPPDSSEANAVDGFVDLDTDQDGSTGDVPWTDTLSDPTTGMGNEFYVDFFTYSADDGAADVVNDLTEEVAGRAPVTFTANSLTVTIPLAMIGDDGAVDAATIVGTADEPTDKAPNQGSVASEEVEPGIISLQGGRFTVQVEWEDPLGQSGPGLLIDKSNDSAVLYFFSQDNWEMLIKVLDGCEINDRFWVFYAATTDVGFVVTVTDTQENVTEQYTNPLGQPANAVTDTSAFATCP